MTSLHDALAEAVADVGPQQVPVDLAERAWETGRSGRRRTVRRRALTGLAAAAVAAALLWLAAGQPGTADSAPATPTAPLAHPERVRADRSPDPLPARIQHVSGLVQSRTDDSWTWRAYTPDGRLWSLDGSVLPPVPSGPGDRTTIVGPAALSPDGSRIAVVRETATVVDESSTPNQTTQNHRYRLDLHDLRTGRHAVVEDVCGVDACFAEPDNLLFSPDGSRVALATGSQIVIASFDGEIVSSGDEPLLPQASGSAVLAGWRDVDEALVVAADRAGDATVIRVLGISASDGDRRELEPLRATATTAEYARSVQYAPGRITIVDGRLAVLELAFLEDGGEPAGHTWSLYDVEGEARRQTVACCGGAADDLLGDARLYEHRSGEIATTIGEDGSGIVLTIDGDEASVATVIDPALDPGDVLVAPASLDAQGSTSLFGTSRGWWAWHPWLTGLGVAGLLVLGGGWLGRRMPR